MQRLWQFAWVADDLHQGDSDELARRRDHRPSNEGGTELRLTLHMFVTLEGVAQAPGGPGRVGGRRAGMTPTTGMARRHISTARRVIAMTAKPCTARSGAIDVGPLLSERFPIEGFPETLELAGSGRAFKVQIQPR
jgi:hypothetical protein